MKTNFKIKYRDNMGSLDESMLTLKQVNSTSELLLYLNIKQNNVYGYDFLPVVEIKYEYAGFDKRINWNTYYVLQRVEGESLFTVAGISDGKLENMCIEHTSEVEWENIKTLIDKAVHG